MIIIFYLKAIGIGDFGDINNLKKEIEMQIIKNEIAKEYVKVSISKSEKYLLNEKGLKNSLEKIKTINYY